MHGAYVDKEECVQGYDSEEEIEDAPPDLSSEVKFPSLGGTPKEEKGPPVQKNANELFSLDLSMDFARALAMTPTPPPPVRHQRLAVRKCSKLCVEHFYKLSLFSSYESDGSTE